MSESNQPKGELYSRVYVERGDPARDSNRMRRRLYEAFRANAASLDGFAAVIARALGEPVPFGTMDYHYLKWFETCHLHDLLSTVTLATRWIRVGAEHHLKSWLNEVEMIFRQEHVAYTVDPSGGVHPLVDQEYQARRSATLLGLAAPRYQGVAHEYAKVQHELAGTNPDFKTALRQAFDAVESLFKLMVNNEADRLTAEAIKSKLKPKIEQLLGHDPTAKLSAGKFLEGFGDWINAAHFYRHGQGSEMPVQIPTDLAIALLDSASVYLRWLASIDKAGCE